MPWGKSSSEARRAPACNLDDCTRRCRRGLWKANARLPCLPSFVPIQLSWCSRWNFIRTTVWFWDMPLLWPSNWSKGLSSVKLRIDTKPVPKIAALLFYQPVIWAVPEVHGPLRISREPLCFCICLQILRDGICERFEFTLCPSSAQDPVRLQHRGNPILW